MKSKHGGDYTPFLQPTGNYSYIVSWQPTPSLLGSKMSINGSPQLIEETSLRTSLCSFFFPLKHSIIAVIRVCSELWRSLQTLIFAQASCFTEQTDRNHLLGEDFIKYKHFGGYFRLRYFQSSSQ